MFKELKVCATFNERTGFGIHASRFFPLLQKLVSSSQGGSGSVTISLLDVVTASQVDIRHPYPSILYTVWESTEYPAAFMEKLKLYDQLWVPSEWQRACSIAQGIPEEFVKVVPEGVDPDVYKPDTYMYLDNPFIFLHVGQWQPRKSTLEICQAFLKAFPDHPGVRLYLSADTLFPSDSYSSTEERMKAYGVDDPRIIPVHFEERDAYVRRLQSAHCFVSCSRSEGWGLPIIEAMACGIPTITADFGGSTEYAGEALVVRVPELKKPHGIYGNWDVPGQWGEPDYDDLAAKMKLVYDYYSDEKERALVLSSHIRSKFSWQAAAERAYAVLEELHQSGKVHPVPTSPVDPEEEIRRFAASRGFTIPSLVKRSAIFAVDCWPNTPEKMDTLRETIEQIHKCGYPVLVSSHYPLPPEVISLADFYIFEKEDRMSGEDHPIYWRILPDGTTETKRATVEYQGCAALNCFRNSIDFCRGRYEWVYQMGADMEVDLEAWLSLVSASKKSMVCIPYEGNKNGIGGGLWAGETAMLDMVIPRLDSWKQYASKYPDLRFVAEKWLYQHIRDLYESRGMDFDDYVDWITIPTTNRFDNVDHTLWGDQFICHFIEGPYLHIIGNPANEYDVTWSFPGQPTYFCLKQKGGTWSRPEIKYHRDWTVTASLNGEVKFTHTLNLTGKRVMISMGSKALGDTLAWIPYVEAFRKLHNCHVIVSGWWMDIMDYPEIEFTIPGSTIDNLYASYDIGCFDDQLDRNKVNWRLTPLQQVAADILGLDYVPLRANLKVDYPASPRPKYICFSEFSTMQSKLWNNPGAWQKVIDHCVSLGYECVSISTEPTQLSNVTSHNGQPIESTISDMAGADFYIGLNHGPYWIAYSLSIPSIMIDGVAESWNNPPNPYRIQSDECHPACFNDPSLPISRAWEWCPRNKSYACTSSITPEQVIKVIDELIETCRITPDEV